MIKYTPEILKKLEDCDTCKWKGRDDRCMTYDPPCIINPIARKYYRQMEGFIEEHEAEFKQFIRMGDIG